jgi:uncharacterized coiled-coil protein SlyX
MSADAIDKLYLMIKALEKQIKTQNKMIEELRNENKLIIENTTKMGNHIDFINGVYEKLTKSYIFRNMFT